MSKSISEHLLNIASTVFSVHFHKTVFIIQLMQFTIFTQFLTQLLKI